MRRQQPGLAGAEINARLRLCEISMPLADRLRLAQLGVRPGSVVTVLAKSVGGGRIVGVGTSRIALDRRTARQMVVEPAA